MARGIQYALQQEGYQVASRARARRASTSRRTRPPISSCSTSGCPGSTASRCCAAARHRLQGAGPRPDGARRRSRQGDRAGARRRRLPDEAIRAARADEPDQGAPAAGLRRPRRRCRRPGDPARRPPDRPRAAARPARRPAHLADAHRVRDPPPPGIATGPVYTRSELLELLRDYEALDQDEKTINVHVSHLRDKIEDDPADAGLRMTVRGVGYAFAER